MTYKNIFLCCVFGAVLCKVAADCPSGWVVNDDSCYLLSHEPMDFLDAERVCNHYEANLVHIDTPAENTFLQGYLKTTRITSAWIGLNDLVAEGRWEWYDTNTVANFTDFYPWEPKGGISENCVAMFEHDFRWADEGCHALHVFVCEARMRAGYSLRRRHDNHKDAMITTMVTLLVTTVGRVFQLDRTCTLHSTKSLTGRTRQYKQ